MVTYTEILKVACVMKKAMFLLNYGNYEAEIVCCSRVIHNWIQIVFTSLPIEREDIVLNVYKYV